MTRKKGLGRGLGALIPGLSQENTEQEAKLEEKKVNEEETAQPKTTKRASRRKPTKKKQEKEVTNTRKDQQEATEDEKKREDDEAASNQEAERHFGLILPIDQMDANPDQPRKEFDQAGLEELAESIRKYGILQPLLVKKNTMPGRPPYEIVAGERRFRASKMAGLDQLPVIVREEGVEESALLSVVENVQREDLNPFEEAQAYREIMQAYALTQQNLAEALGKSRAYVANATRLLQLDEDSLVALREGTLTSSQARTLLAEKDLRKRAKLRRLFIEGRTNVNRQEQKQKRVRQKDLYISGLEENLGQALGREVQIQKRRKGWEIQLTCYSTDDLNQLSDLLLGGRD